VIVISIGTRGSRFAVERTSRSSEKLGICGRMIEQRVKTNSAGTTNSEPGELLGFPQPVLVYGFSLRIVRTRKIYRTTVLSVV